MELTELRCRCCGALLTGENVDLGLRIARCGHCDAVFALDRPDGGGSAQPATPERPEVPMPGAIQVEVFGDSLEIRRRWFGCAAIFLIVFAVFWNGFMIVWHSIAMATGMFVMSAFGLIHTAVGIGVGYLALAMILNTTTIKVDRGMLTVSHGPLPWPGAKSLPIHEIKQFFCRETVHHGKNGTSYTYEVRYVTQTGSKEKLLTGLSNSDQALFIEQQIERHLGIKDEAVHGELSR